MENVLRVDKYLIDTPIINILYDLRTLYPRGKLRQILPKTDEIILTCVNSEHSNANEAHPDAHINLNPKVAPFAVYHCFACGLKTDFVGFIAHYFDSSRDFAKQWLIKHYGKLSAEVLQLGDAIDLKKSKAPVSKVLNEAELLASLQDYCPYLAKRGITRAAAKKFNVKYDQITRQVVFPVYNINNQLVMLAKRSIDSKMFFMTKDVEKEVYGLNTIISNKIKYCLLVEGPIDMLTCWSHGIPAVATLGQVSDYQIAQINKAHLTSIYLCFDNDSAGRRFTAYTKNKLDKSTLITEIALPISKKDVNELTDEEWQELIDKYSLKKQNIIV